jgi:hypothetical protein
MQTLTQEQLTKTARPWFIGACVLGFVAFLGLLAHVFMRYPDSRLSTSTGPTSNIPTWFGADGAGIAYMLFGLLIACLYVYVSMQGTSGHGVWRLGVLLGAALGFAWLVVGVLDAFISAPAAELLLDGAVLIVPVAAGILGASQTGRFGSGPLAGFWCGVAAALLIALSMVAIDVVFASHFLQTSWPQDRHCNLHSGDALAACEISDDLGFAGTILIALPVIMAGLGAIGGAIGLANTRAGQVDAPREDNNSRAPLIFSLIMIVLFVCTILFDLL